MRLTTVLGSFALLAACDATPPPASQADTRIEEGSNVFEPLTDAVDRARAVEDTVREQEEALRRRIEEAEGQ